MTKGKTMDDLISRQDAMSQEDAMNMSDKRALKILKPMRDMMRDQNGCPISDAYFALEKAIDALTAQQWIPCSEILPDAQTEVIVSCIDDSGDTRFLYTSSGWVTTDGEYWIVDNEINSFVKAWMPLPEPYREEEQP